MASTVIRPPELHEYEDERLKDVLLFHVPNFAKRMDRGAGDLIGDLESIIEHNLWSRVGFDSFEAYAKETLSHTEAWCHEMIHIFNREWSPARQESGTVGELQSAVELARAQTDENSSEYVSQGKRTDLEPVCNTYMLKNERTSKPGILRRLARDRPDLLDRVETGELTANAAAIEAGFRRPSIQLSAGTDPAKAAAKIREKFGDDFALELKSAL